MPTRARQDRAERTRAAILSAAVASLVEHGFGGTTMERIQRLAGVSRGALTHHFSSMDDLLVAAVESISLQQSEEIRDAMADAGTGPLDALVDTMHEIMQRPVFLAGLELWIAARTDEKLRAALSTSARATTEMLRNAIAAAFEPPLSAPQLAMAFDGLMSLLRGLALGSVVRDRPERERAILHAWLCQFGDAPT